MLYVKFCGALPTFVMGEDRHFKFST